MNFTINPEQIENSFYDIAFQLMNNHAIKVKDSYYRIIDCEFYFQSEENIHKDIYTHGHDEQAKNGSWYFHGSGIDITIGNKEKNAKGGILIRGIAKLSFDKNANGDFIERSERCKKTIGPLKVLTTLFSHFNNVFDIDNSFYLIKKEEIENFEFSHAKLFNCQRVGLNILKDKADFFNKPYRFITFPYLPHTEKEKIKIYLKDSGIVTSDEEMKALFNPKYDK